MATATAPGRPLSPRVGRVTAALHHLRTEGGTSIRQSLAVGAGLYIGCTPFLGFHLLLTMLIGRVLGLNRVLMYAASNISNPFVAPFLYATEIQTGAWLRTGQLYSPAVADTIRLQGLAIDILLGSVIVGLALAAAGTALTYTVLRAGASDPAVDRLVDAAAARFLPLGTGPWEFARAKMRHDPVYLDVLRDGVLPHEGRILDLGCGAGLMLSLLAAAREQFARGEWPIGWPDPPTGLDLHGIELRPRVARRAREILQGVATIEERDLAHAHLPACDAILIFDVLHLMPADAQDRLLAAIADALPPNGVIVLREANPEGGWRFQLVRFGNRLVAWLHGRRRRPFHFRRIGDWQDTLLTLGFSVRLADTTNRTPFANVTLYAQRSGRDYCRRFGKKR